MEVTNHVPATNHAAINVLDLPEALLDSIIWHLDILDIKALFCSGRFLRRHLQKPKYWSSFTAEFCIVQLTPEDLGIIIDEENCVIRQLNKKCKLDVKFEIDFMYKKVKIFQASTLNCLLFKQLIQYFGKWEIKANVMIENTFIFNSNMVENTNIIDIFKQYFINNNSNKRTVIKLIDLIDYAKDNILSLSINGSIFVNEKNSFSILDLAEFDRFYKSLCAIKTDNEFFSFESLEIVVNDIILPILKKHYRGQRIYDGYNFNEMYSIVSKMNETNDNNIGNNNINNNNNSININNLSSIDKTHYSFDLCNLVSKYVTSLHNIRQQRKQQIKSFYNFYQFLSNNEFNSLQHIHCLNENVFDASLYKEYQEYKHIGSGQLQLDNSCFIKKIKICDLESCKSFGETSWVYQTLNYNNIEKLNGLIMVRLFNCHFESHNEQSYLLPIVLPRNLEFLRITYRVDNIMIQRGMNNPDVDHDGNENNVSNNGGNDRFSRFDSNETISNMDGLATIKESLLKQTENISQSHNNLIVDLIKDIDLTLYKKLTDLLKDNLNDDLNDDLGVSEKKENKNKNEEDEMIVNEMNNKKEKQFIPMEKGRMVYSNVDFTNCNKLTEIVLDWQSISVLYPLFIDFNQSGFKQSNTKMSKEKSFVYVSKSNIDFDDILPCLKRIVIAEYAMNKGKFELFLRICKQWITKRHLKIYFAKMDQQSIQRLFFHNDNNIHTPSIDYNSNQDNRDHDDGFDGTRHQTFINNSDNVFQWREWNKYIVASRLSVTRWRDSEHYLLYTKCTNWKFWWWKDVHYTWESYLNWV